MSTIPGEGTWRDAGLTELDLIDAIDPSPAEGAEVYQPDDPRPDLDGAADPADVAEQHAVVPEDEGEAYRD
ncbi:hypothetical protein [Cellulomonas sp. NPDC089187]|uniref:hypothetical protein n=1 Tax=Cellulomonas sp. NPDC089187 TaxID=3154970 RepID=UPI003440DE9E